MELTGIWFLVPLALLALLFLLDVLRQMSHSIRNRFRSDQASTGYLAGFNLRRPDSTLRERYHTEQPRSRTTEICKDKVDPYDP